MTLKRPVRLATLLLGSLLACNQPDAGLDRQAALDRAIAELVDGSHPTAVLITDAPLPAGAVVSTYRTQALLEPTSVTLAGPAWLVWVDDAPMATFGHPSRVALVDVASGELTVLDTQTWPLVDGAPVFTDADREPTGWDHAAGLPELTPRAARALPPRMSVDCVPVNPGRALVINGWEPGESGQANFGNGSLHMKDAFEGVGLDTTYLGPQGASEADGVASDEAIDMYFQTAAKELQPGDDFVLFLNGHGFIAEDFKPGETVVGGHWESDVERWLARLPAGVNIIVIINGCHSGGMLDGLSCVADLALTATSEELPSYGDLDNDYWEDINPNDSGNEWASSLAAAWWDVLTTPEEVAEVADIAQSTGSTFVRVLTARAFEGAREYDAAERAGYTTPMIRSGAAKTDPPDVVQDPSPPMCEAGPPPSCDPASIPGLDEIEKAINDLLGEPADSSAGSELICPYSLQLEPGNETLHSDGEKTALAAGACDLLAVGGAPRVELPGLSDKVCGDNGDSYIICADSGPETTYKVLWAKLAADFPIVPEYYYQYGFVLDLDGEPGNNYEASPNYPADFFDGTDRWYQLSGSPGGAWTLGATDVVDGAPMSRPSGAHVVVSGANLLLLLPESEFGAASAPGIRFTTFEHAGDWGATEPWTGDLYPIVGAPLWTMEP